MKLVTREDVKTFLGITASTYDSLLDLQIDLIEGEIDAYVDKTLGQTAITGEVLNYVTKDYDPVFNPPLELYSEYPNLYLDNYPVHTDSVTLKHGSTTISASNYVIDYDRGIIQLRKYYDDSKNTLTVNYTSGYTSSTASTYTTPNELRLLIYEGVKQLFEGSGTAKQGSGNVDSKTVGDFSVSYGQDNKQTSQSALVKTYIGKNQTIINRYKRVSL